MVKYKGISRELIDLINSIMKEFEESAIVTGLSIFKRNTNVRAALDKKLSDNLEPILKDMFSKAVITSNKLYRQEVTALQDLTKVKFKYDREILDSISEISVFNMRDPKYKDLFTKKEINQLRSTILKAKYNKSNESEMISAIRSTVDLSKKSALMTARFETQNLENAAIENALSDKNVKKEFVKKYNIKDGEARESHKYSSTFDAGNGPGIADDDGYFTAQDGSKFIGPPNPVSPWNCRCFVTLEKRK